MKKRLCKVILKGKEDEYVTAQRHRKEGEQYVFESDEDGDVQFFDVPSVIGVVIVKEDASTPD